MDTKKVSKKRKSNAVLHGIIRRLHFASVMFGSTIIALIMMITFTWIIYWIITGNWVLDDLEKIADKLS